MFNYLRFKNVAVLKLFFSVCLLVRDFVIFRDSRFRSHGMFRWTANSLSPLFIVPALLSIRRPEGPFFAPTVLLLFDEVIELRYVLFLLLLAAGLACRWYCPCLTESITVCIHEAFAKYFNLVVNTQSKAKIMKNFIILSFSIGRKRQDNIAGTDL